MKEKKRILALIFGFIECATFAGIVHGWSYLAIVLKDDGIFSHLCRISDNISHIQAPVNITNHFEDLPHQNTDAMSHEISSYRAQLHSHSSVQNMGRLEAGPGDLSITCPERDRTMRLIYILSTTVMMVMAALLGKCFDYFGLRLLRLGASVLFIPGSLLVALADVDRPWMIFPGVILMSLAGMSLIISNIHLSLLAGERKLMMSSLYSGAVDSCMWVFLVVKVLWECGVSRKVSVGILALLWLVVILDTFLLVPKFKINWEEERLRAGFEGLKIPRNVYRDVLTLRECLCSPVCVSHCVWTCIMFVRLVSFLGSFETWIAEMTDGDPQKGQHMTNVFSVLMFGSVLFTPLVGLSMDWCRKRLFSTTNNMTRNSFAAMPVLFIHGAITVLFSICVLLKGQFFVYVSFFFFIAFKSGLFAIFYSYANLVIPPDHYGVLLGIASLLAACTGLLQFPLVYWAQSSSLGFLPMNILLLLLTVLALCHPICICIVNRPGRSQSTHISSSQMLETEMTKSGSENVIDKA